MKRKILIIMSAFLVLAVGVVGYFAFEMIKQNPASSFLKIVEEMNALPAYKQETNANIALTIDEDMPNNIEFSNVAVNINGLKQNKLNIKSDKYGEIILESYENPTHYNIDVKKLLMADYFRKHISEDNVEIAIGGKPFLNLSKEDAFSLTETYKQFEDKIVSNLISNPKNFYKDNDKYILIVEHDQFFNIITDVLTKIKGQSSSTYDSLTNNEQFSEIANDKNRSADIRKINSMIDGLLFYVEEYKSMGTYRLSYSIWQDSDFHHELIIERDDKIIASMNSIRKKEKSNVVIEQPSNSIDLKQLSQSISMVNKKSSKPTTSIISQAVTSEQADIQLDAFYNEKYPNLVKVSNAAQTIGFSKPHIETSISEATLYTQRPSRSVDFEYLYDEIHVLLGNDELVEVVTQNTYSKKEIERYGIDIINILQQEMESLIDSRFSIAKLDISLLEEYNDEAQFNWEESSDEWLYEYQIIQYPLDYNIKDEQNIYEQTETSTESTENKSDKDYLITITFKATKY